MEPAPISDARREATSCEHLQETNHYAPSLLPILSNRMPAKRHLHIHRRAAVGLAAAWHRTAATRLRANRTYVVGGLWPMIAVESAFSR